jgi:hypothetical protein
VLEYVHLDRLNIHLISVLLVWQRIERESARIGVYSLVVALILAPLAISDSKKRSIIAGLSGVGIVSLTVSFLSFQLSLAEE